MAEETTETPSDMVVDEDNAAGPVSVSPGCPKQDEKRRVEPLETSGNHKVTAVQEPAAKVENEGALKLVVETAQVEEADAVKDVLPACSTQETAESEDLSLQDEVEEPHDDDEAPAVEVEGTKSQPHVEEEKKDDDVEVAETKGETSEEVDEEANAKKVAMPTEELHPFADPSVEETVEAVPNEYGNEKNPREEDGGKESLNAHDKAEDDGMPEETPIVQPKVEQIRGPETKSSDEQNVVEPKRVQQLEAFETVTTDQMADSQPPLIETEIESKILQAQKNDPVVESSEKGSQPEVRNEKGAAESGEAEAATSESEERQAQVTETAQEDTEPAEEAGDEMDVLVDEPALASQGLDFTSDDAKEEPESSNALEDPGESAFVGSEERGETTQIALTTEDPEPAAEAVIEEQKDVTGVRLSRIYSGVHPSTDPSVHPCADSRTKSGARFDVFREHTNSLADHASFVPVHLNPANSKEAKATTAATTKKANDTTADDQDDDNPFLDNALEAAAIATMAGVGDELFNHHEVKWDEALNYIKKLRKRPLPSALKQLDVLLGISPDEQDSERYSLRNYARLFVYLVYNELEFKPSALVNTPKSHNQDSQGLYGAAYLPNDKSHEELPATFVDWKLKFGSSLKSTHGWACDQGKAFAFHLANLRDLRETAPKAVCLQMAQLELPGLVYYCDHKEAAMDLIIAQAYEMAYASCFPSVTTTVMERLLQRPSTVIRDHSLQDHVLSPEAVGFLAGVSDEGALKTLMGDEHIRVEEESVEPTTERPPKPLVEESAETVDPIADEQSEVPERNQPTSEDLVMAVADEESDKDVARKAELADDTSPTTKDDCEPVGLSSEAAAPAGDEHVGAVESMKPTTHEDTEHVTPVAAGEMEVAEIAKPLEDENLEAAVAVSGKAVAVIAEEHAESADNMSPTSEEGTEPAQQSTSESVTEVAETAKPSTYGDAEPACEELGELAISLAEEPEGVAEDLTEEDPEPRDMSAGELTVDEIELPMEEAEIVEPTTRERPEPATKQAGETLAADPQVAVAETVQSSAHEDPKPIAEESATDDPQPAIVESDHAVAVAKEEQATEAENVQPSGEGHPEPVTVEDASREPAASLPEEQVGASATTAPSTSEFSGETKAETETNGTVRKESHMEEKEMPFDEPGTSPLIEEEGVSAPATNEALEVSEETAPFDEPHVSSRNLPFDESDTPVQTPSAGKLNLPTAFGGENGTPSFSSSVLANPTSLLSPVQTLKNNVMIPTAQKGRSPANKIAIPVAFSSPVVKDELTPVSSPTPSVSQPSTSPARSSPAEKVATPAALASDQNGVGAPKLDSMDKSSSPVARETGPCTCQPDLLSNDADVELVPAGVDKTPTRNEKESDRLDPPKQEPVKQSMEFDPYMNLCCQERACCIVM